MMGGDSNDAAAKCPVNHNKEETSCPFAKVFNFFKKSSSNNNFFLFSTNPSNY